jgi:hypothetical protein
VTALPREARDGLMRAWLELLRERHPGVNWIRVDTARPNDDENTNRKEARTT